MSRAPSVPTATAATPTTAPPAGASRPRPGTAAPSPEAGQSPGAAPVGTTGRYHPLVPARIFDSRQSGGLVRAGADRVVQVRGLGGVPADGVSAVVVNLTSAGTTAVTDVQVYPTGSRPAVRTSNLNPRPGGAVATLVTTALGRDGTISLSTAAGSAHLVVDVVGWYGDVAGAGFHPLVPARIADTRTEGRPVVAGADREIAVTGVGGVPATGVEAVVVNLTATGSTASTDLQLYPAGAEPAVRTSNLNLGRSQTRANLAVVKVGRDGRIGVSTAGGRTHVVLDVVGWYGEGGLRFVPAAPVRALDTRDVRQPVVAGADREVVLAGRLGEPAEAQAVVGSVTLVAATRPADLQLFPSGQRPERRTSNVNVPDGLPVPNLAVLGLGQGGRRRCHSAAARHTWSSTRPGGSWSRGRPRQGPVLQRHHTTQACVDLPRMSTSDASPASSARTVLSTVTSAVTLTTLSRGSPVVACGRKTLPGRERDLPALDHQPS